jgi:quinol monooxygenase YgiN
MGELWGLARFRIHEGKLEEFKRLAARSMEIVRTEDTGTLQYEVYLNDDQTECIVLERYRGFDAFIEHGAHLGELGQAIVATGSVTGACLSEPTAELRAQFAGSAIQLFTPYLSL